MCDEHTACTGCVRGEYNIGTYCVLPTYCPTHLTAGSAGGGLLVAARGVAGSDQGEGAERGARKPKQRAPVPPLATVYCLLINSHLRNPACCFLPTALRTWRKLEGSDRLTTYYTQGARLTSHFSGGGSSRARTRARTRCSRRYRRCSSDLLLTYECPRT